MRLNDGLPVWHVSVSAQDRDGPVLASIEVEQRAVELLEGVGRRDGEWWLFSQKRVGHLRVGITEGEALLMWPDTTPPQAITDAGESGVYRQRTTV